MTKDLRERIDKLVPCVQCDGSGGIQTGEDEFEQCQFCYQLRFKAVDDLLALIQDETEASEKRGFYSGQANAGVSLEECHANYKQWLLAPQTNNEKEV